MAPSTSISHPPQEDASAASNGNGNGVSPVSKAATKEEDATILNPSDFVMPQKFDNPYKHRQYLKERLALGFRLFAKNGFDAGVAGHITVRDPVEPDTFWLNPFGVAWPLLKASDLIRVNAEGKVIDGGPVKLLNTAGSFMSPPSPSTFAKVLSGSFVSFPSPPPYSAWQTDHEISLAYMIHHAIHEARPDITCVAHSHSLYGQAFSTLGRNLDIISQDTCAFYNDVVLYNSFGGIVLGKEEGLHIAAALGDKKAAILQNHGLVTCGKSVESCVYWFLSLERCCHQQLLADAAAGGRGHETVKIDREDAEFTYKSIGSELAGWFSGKPAFDMMEHESGFAYKM
ncbi:putative class II Aldolase and Adducin domain-containing protein [Colletotrichum sublineola]|uniref:Putative class II Aldolase and Adducin domain-containing protein n=1 Tax=Colletotrichum sublineola TaxID=1173701 RepID=A0A066XPH6_COLSU|nr:putative class II Aldolase and Adducin domain-containing protein [Colletotrichum sublineola]